MAACHWAFGVVREAAARRVAGVPGRFRRRRIHARVARVSRGRGLVDHCCARCVALRGGSACVSL
nr:hypothetical protein [Streptomyces aurantiacus]